MIKKYVVPIGTSNFRTLTTSVDPDGKKNLFVDKTNFIKEILRDRAEVLLITRPRRFGKTINVSMLQHFLSDKVDGLLTKDLFQDLLIANDAASMEHQGKYPVIFISFKDSKGKSYEEIEVEIREQIKTVYHEFRYLLDNKLISPENQKSYEQILLKQSSTSSLKNAIKNLSRYIYEIGGVKPYLLIDEYDTPIQASYGRECYEDVLDLMRSMFSTALKDNSNIAKGILTGITRIAKESIFSELNNLRISSLLDENYSEYFGFTEKEVDELFNKSELLTDRNQIKDWYNGYTCGKTILYNPWSIMNSIADLGKIKTYWINTSGNDLVVSLIINGGMQVHERLAVLLQDKSIVESLDEHLVYEHIEQNRAAIWTLLVMAGYLKIVNSFEELGSMVYELALPNQEVKYFYQQAIQIWLSGEGSAASYHNFLKDLLNGNLQQFEQQLLKLIQATFSVRDVSKNEPERIYHAFMLGLLTALQPTHEIISNQESGLGYADILIIPKDLNQNAIILEFKAPKNETNLAQEANLALEQIKAKKYAMQIEHRGIKKIISIGIAFAKKEVSIAFNKNWVS